MWQAYLFQTTTGMVGPQIQLKPSATWSVSLNGTETGHFELSKSDLPPLDLKYWLAPWWAGVLLTYNDTPIYAGPIIGRPYETFNTVTLDTGGMRSILARRLVAPELADWSGFSQQTVAFRGLSLGMIAKSIVFLVQRKKGGMLPISYPIPDQYAPDDGDHQRTYDSFNIQNIGADAILTKLSGVHNGPDIIFRPRYAATSRITFDMWTGNENNPHIPQPMTPVWDTTVVDSSVSDMQMTVTGAYQTDRVYASGAGMDKGTLIRVASDTHRTAQGFPLLESTYASGDSTDPAVVQAHAQAALASNNEELHEINMTVRADGTYPLGTFWPGYQVKIAIKGWLSLPDGVYTARLLNFNGTLTNDVKLSLQIEK